MTNDIVQTDVELARRMLENGSPDDEVVLALIRRRVSEESSRRVVEDLHAGRIPEMKPSIELALSRKRSSAGSHSPGEGFPQGKPVQRRRRRRRHSRRSRSDGKSWAVVAGVACVAAVTLFVVAYLLDMLPWQSQEQYTTPESGYQETAVPDDVSNRVERLPAGLRSTHTEPPRDPLLAIRPGESSEMRIEIRDDGLYLDGKNATSANALALLTEMLGNPTRTNQTELPGKVIHIFDRHGLLVYSQINRGDDNVMLDFEGLGGDHGARSPFAGKLSIGGQAIAVDTDSAALAANQKLGMTNSTASEGIVAGKHKGVGFYCAYLKSTNRLSLVEIDLR